MKTLKRAEAFPDFLDFQKQVNSKKSHPPGEWLFLIGIIRIGFFRYFSFPLQHLSPTLSVESLGNGYSVLNEVNS